MGKQRGTYFMPEVEDEVLVAFDAGDLNRPYVVGALWNDADGPPEERTGDNDFRTIVSRSGMRLRFDDSDGAARVTIDTPGGPSITLDDEGQRVEIRGGHGHLFGCRELRHDERKVSRGRVVHTRRG